MRSDKFKKQVAGEAAVKATAALVKEIGVYNGMLDDSERAFVLRCAVATIHHGIEDALKLAKQP